MQGENRGAPEEGLILAAAVMALVGAAAFAAWYFLRTEIVTTVFAVQHWLMAPAHLVTDRYAGLDRQVLAADPADPAIGIGTLWQLAHDVGTFWRWPAFLLLATLAAACARRVAGHYRRKLDLRGLMAEQARTFRFIAPYVRRRLGPVEPAAGAPRPADPALHPWEWADRFARDADGTFNHALASAALCRQLGPLWRGPAAAAPHVRVMFTVIALHAARRRQDALDLLGDFAEALPDGRKEGPAGPEAPLQVPAWVARRADAWLRDPEVAGPCERIATGHAFTATALMSALCHARQRAGVLNPGTFTFLQLVDRPLFFALDSLGAPTPGLPWHRSAAQAPYAEAIGAREHWAAERDAGRALFVPSLENAVAAIRAAAEDGRAVSNDGSAA